MSDTGVLLDGVIGALAGALITGSAQVWTYRRTQRDGRQSQSSAAAQQLLGVMNEAIRVLRSLPHTTSPAGSPLSYGERLTMSQPMRDSLRGAKYTTAPLLSDPRLVQEFIQFDTCCNVVSSPTVNAADIFTAVNDAVTYGHHVMNSLTAHIGGQPLPAPPVLGFLSSYLPPMPLPAPSVWRGLLPPDHG